MLQPIKTKFRKAHKGRIHGQATSGQNLAFGEYGLKALEPERVTARQIEAARRAASICRAVIRSGSIALSPNWPNASVAALVAIPWMRPLCALRNLVFDGCSMTNFPYAVSRRGRPASASARRLSCAMESCSMISPLKIQTLTPQVP